ncbi:MAG: amidohydrolase family protein [Myxococcota bacterium]
MSPRRAADPAPPGSGASATLLRGVRIWTGSDPGGSDLTSSDHACEREPGFVRIEEGRVVAVGRGEGPADGAEVVELANGFAIPGLIDAHVHIGIDPARGVAAQARQPAHERWLAMTQRARAMLRAGITTARDLGGPDGLELALRDAIARGELAGPRLVCAGQPVTTPGGHCHFWGGEAATDADALRVVDRQLARGADWIKVMATGGVATAGTRPADAQLDAASIARVVARAAASGRRVAAHCHGTAGIRNAALGGVATIEHCSFAGADGFGADLDTASTDAGIPGVAHDRLAEGLAALARYAGLSPAQALRAATSGAARALGLECETGRLAPGLAADVLVLEADPLVDLGALARPLAVFARGQRVALDDASASAEYAAPRAR